MARRNLLITLMALSLLLGGTVATTDTGLAKTPRQTAVSSRAQNPCATKTDAEIVAEINGKIKADKRFNGQWRHFNVSSINHVVTINGWVNGRVQYNDFLKYARTKCVKKLRIKEGKDVFFFPYLHVGCPTGMKFCGDICIERNQDCNLIQ
ncbi:MAG TPA: BON domain-containing protein [Blastocatellia bacterium]|nr:BON domain-containing protein [Blastocatellia bacterium]